MAICIDGNFVCLGGGCFCQTPTGIEFSGEACAGGFCDLTKSPLQTGATLSGYVSGGRSSTDVIQKFPFSSDTNATDVGELTLGRYSAAGQSSSISGYTSGGFGPPLVDTIDKFPFAADGAATDVGELTQGRYNIAGQSSSVSGYSAGGKSPAPTPSADHKDTIDKFPFLSDTPATDVGNLTQGIYGASGQSSLVSGYVSGGRCPPQNFDRIDKFPFASDTNATDIGELTCDRLDAAGQSSTASGYTSGGNSDPAEVNIIDKFPFSSDTNATDVGDLVAVKFRLAGQQV